MAGKTLPMFPLGTVLFPHAVLPLHLFEERYRLLAETCLRGDGRFGVVLIERGFEVGGGDARFAVGTVARIVEAAAHSRRAFPARDGGHRTPARAQVARRRPVPARGDRPPRRAACARRGRAAELRTSVQRLLSRVLAMSAELGDRAAPVGAAELDDDPARASYEAASMAPVGPLDGQRLLELDDPVTRLTELETMLTDTAEILGLRLAGG